MKDRATRHSGVGGLNFMIDDEGIRQQMIAYMPALMGAKKQLVGKFEIPVGLKDNSVEFWKAYFNAKEKLNKKTIEQVQKYVKEVNNKNWKEFHKAVDAFVSEQLKSVFLAKTSGSEDKVSIRNIPPAN
jgi:hypothetical protein